MLELEKFKTYSDFYKPITTLPNSKDLINWSDIIDKLIRLAAKNTESYASDIVINIESITKMFRAPDFHRGSWLFGFRRDGVDHAEWILGKHEAELKDYRCIWRLDFLQADNGYYFFKLYEVCYRA